VTISTTTPSATIYYTTNGTTPTTASAVFSASSPIAVNASETLQAIATASGYSTSAVGSAAYTITLPAATPTFNPAGGSYSSAQSVTISTTTPSATIYYTTNGTTPTTGSAVFSASSPIPVSASETLKAIATATGYSTSAVGSATYTITLPAATPTFNAPGGSYSSAQSVTISTTTPSATIYYTTNGTTPTTASAVFSASSPIAVNASETLQAIATASGYSTSAVGSATYTINSPPVGGAPPPTAVLLSGSQVNVKASGLAYSRATRTFTGTVTITNVSSSTIAGPLQIVFSSLTSGVTLANATGSFGGWSYITVSGVGSLAPGQSATVAVDFKDPSMAMIDFTPMTYSGSFN
jgi:hypothetical protein